MHRNTVFMILCILVVAGMVSGESRGRAPEAVNGWILENRGLGNWKNKRIRPRGWEQGEKTKTDYWARRAKTWHIPLLRSLCLWGLWQTSGQVGSDWLQLLPWIIWMLPEGSGEWCWIKRGLWQMERVLTLGYVGLSLYHMLGGSESVLIGCVMGVGEKPLVAVERTEDGDWQVTLSGHFTLRISDDHPFRLRLLLIFLGSLQSENDQRRSRRTRDGRTPFVRQEQLAEWAQVKQECISRWNRYWLQGDWAKLLSLRQTEILTGELVERIVTVFASFPGWSNGQVYEYLRQQGFGVSQAQVDQISQQSGWQLLRATLRERFDLQNGFRLREEWLVSQLLRQVQELVSKVEAGGGLTPEERIGLLDLEALSAQAGVTAQTPLPVQPWLQTMEGMLLAQQGTAPEAAIRCTYCTSTNIAPKSKKPRLKKFYDAQGQFQTVEVLRYYCHNPICAFKSFTYFSSGLLPYSHYRTQVHLLAIQMYAWGYSTYRRTGSALGVHSMTAYRWVSAWGHDLLPIAALFGLVKSSGVVGVDEKYVLVPKNNKPEGKMRRWMYVYLAVDAWTYDLLHIAIYPHNNEHSAKAFLLALRAKGYHPQVVVTDLRQDYGPLIAQVFPDAVHHECIFHALQNVQKHIKEVYGSHYAQDHPEADQLKQQIYAIFDTLSQEVALSRYQHVLALKASYLLATPGSFVIFDFIELHWPKLLNAIGSDTIPTTNNVTELVIRRFDQHYQNFCGFQSIETAQVYLAVFEKLYRFTPFSQDAQPRIRGKSPLQLAGYPVSQLPMSSICSGLSIDWPTETRLVPN